MQFRSTAGETVEIPAQLAVTCIGYESLPCCSATPENGVFANDGGKIDDRLYVVGWAKRGPSGTIPTNRVEAQQVAQKIAQEIQECESSRNSGACATFWMSVVAVRLITTGWKRIDAMELSRAGAERCREKLCSTNEMLEAAHRRPASACLKLYSLHRSSRMTTIPSQRLCALRESNEHAR